MNGNIKNIGGKTFYRTLTVDNPVLKIISIKKLIN